MIVRPRGHRLRRLPAPNREPLPAEATPDPPCRVT